MANVNAIRCYPSNSLTHVHI